MPLTGVAWWSARIVWEDPVALVLASSSPGPVTRRCREGAVGVRDDIDGDEAARNGGGGWTGVDEDDEAAT